MTLPLTCNCKNWTVKQKIVLNTIGMVQHDIV